MLIILHNGSRHFTIYTIRITQCNILTFLLTQKLHTLLRHSKTFNLVFICLICSNHMFLNRKCVDIKLTKFWCVNILNLFSCFDVATKKLISYVHIFKIFSSIGSANSGQVKQDHNSIMETIVIRMFHSYIFYWIPIQSSGKYQCHLEDISFWPRPALSASIGWYY